METTNKENDDIPVSMYRRSAWWINDQAIRSGMKTEDVIESIIDEHKANIVDIDKPQQRPINGQQVKSESLKIE